VRTNADLGRKKGKEGKGRRGEREGKGKGLFTAIDFCPGKKRGGEKKKENVLWPLRGKGGEEKREGF